MKLYLDAKTLSGDSVAIELIASPEDTVGDVKARAVLAEPNPFPDQKLLREGKELRDDMRLSECGIEDGCRLGFVTCPSEKALVQQLRELLQSGDSMRVEEVGLMYTLKHGVPIGSALHALGEGKVLLKGFLERHSKDFTVNDGWAKAVASEPEASIASTTPLITVTLLVMLHVPATTPSPTSLELAIGDDETVANLKKRAATAAQLPSPLGMRLMLKGESLADDKRLTDCGVSSESTLELISTWSEEMLTKQLVALLLQQGPMSKVELDDAHSCRYGVSATQAVQMLAWGEKLQSFLARQPTLALEKGCVSLACVSPASLVVEADCSGNQAYLDLHTKLCHADFQGRAAQALDRLAGLLSKETFLNISEVVCGGAAAAGMAIPGAVGAELTVFLDGMPAAGQEAWLPCLVKSAAHVLTETLCGREDVTEIFADGAELRLRTAGVLGEVRVHFAPSYNSHSEALQTVGAMEGGARVAGAKAAFAAHSARFSERLPEGVKAAVRLLTWWREQQHWSSEATRPSHTLLELVAAHAATQQKPRSLREAVEGSLAALSRFEELHVMWPTAVRSYREGDLWAPLREQTPLVTHPANPFANAALDVFEPRELIERARLGMVL